MDFRDSIRDHLVGNKEIFRRVLCWERTSMPLYPGQKAIPDLVCSEYVGTRTVELLFLAKLQHVDCSNDRMVQSIATKLMPVLPKRLQPKVAEMC